MNYAEGKPFLTVDSVESVTNFALKRHIKSKRRRQETARIYAAAIVAARETYPGVKEIRRLSGQVHH
jgi:hypothetical protein